MKHTTTSVSSLSLLALATAATLTSDALAGAPAKPAPKESGALLEKLNATVEVGYDSAYYFRGLWFSNNNVWEGLTLSLPVNEQLSFTLGTVYTSSTLTNIPARFNGGTQGRLKYSELDLIAGASFDAGFAKFGLIYTYYNFFDTFSGSMGGGTFGNAKDQDSTVKSAQDLGLTVSKSFGPVNATVGAWYDFKVNGKYFEAAVDCPIEVTSWLSVVPSVVTGYGMDYYTYANINGSGSVLNAEKPGKSDGFTSVRTAISTPIKLTDSATFTPYVAVNFSGSSRYVSPNNASGLNSVEGQNDFYFGGKMSLSF